MLKFREQTFLVLYYLANKDNNIFFTFLPLFYVFDYDF